MRKLLILETPWKLNSLFRGNTKGFVFLPGTPYGQAFQERTREAATTPAAIGDPIGTYLDLITGVYAVAPSDAKRPTLGSSYATFSGGQVLVTDTIDFSYTDKMTAWTAFQHNTTSTAILAELSTNVSNTGSFYACAVNDPTTGKLGFTARNNAVDGVSTTAASYGSGVKNRTALSIDLSKEPSTQKLVPRVSNVLVPVTNVANSSDVAGNFRSDAVYIGSRAGTSLFLNGPLYGVILAGSTEDERSFAQIDAIMASRMG